MTTTDKSVVAFIEATASTVDTLIEAHNEDTTLINESNLNQEKQEEEKMETVLKIESMSVGDIFIESAQNQEVLDMQSNFRDLRKSNFRVHGNNGLMTVEDLSVEMQINHFNSTIKKELKNFDEIIIEGRKLTDIQIDRRKLLFLQLANLMQQKKLLVSRLKKAPFNLKNEVKDYSRKVYFTLSSSEIAISIFSTNGKAISTRKEAFLSQECKIDGQVSYRATKALQTAFSDANDYIFFNLHIDHSELRIEAVNCKTGLSRFYGVLGYTATPETK